VLAKEPGLVDGGAELRAELEELTAWRQHYITAVDGLELHSDAQKHFEQHPPPDPPPGPEGLDGEFSTWILLGLPLSATDRHTLEHNEPFRHRLDPEEFAGTAMLNEIRYLLGLAMVRIEAKLGDAARDHSSDMERLGFFDHTSPVPGKRTPSDRASRFGTSGGAENIARGHRSGPSAIQGWWYSPGHHRNMLGGHGRTGLGRSGELWTQMFGG
jgi:uncharacterized protein YkwD